MILESTSAFLCDKSGVLSDCDYLGSALAYQNVLCRAVTVSVPFLSSVLQNTKFMR